MVCPNCNRELPPKSFFCSYCGQLLGQSPRQTASDPPRLVLETGGGYGTEIQLNKKEMILGRSNDCDIPVDDGFMSREHAKLVQIDNHYLIDDLGSVNGTFVNQIAVVEPQVLHDGDRITMGRASLIFQHEASKAPARPAAHASLPNATPASASAPQVGQRPPIEPEPLVPPPFQPVTPSTGADAHSIEAKGLLKVFKMTMAVNRIDLQVRRGEIFGLIGPDGAGKTTTIRMICGLTGISSGSVRVQGIDVARDPDRVKERIGYMAQRFNLYGDLTVAENMSFFAEFYGVPKHERIKRTRELLAFSQLTQYANRQADRLSGGMKQKLALACTLIHEPEILFLDEPTTGVDPVSRREFWRIIYSLLGRGVTIFVSTPYMDEAERCHRIGFMSEGKIIACDDPQTLKTMVQGEMLEIAAQPRKEAQRLMNSIPEVQSAVVFGGMLHVLVKNAANDANRIAARLLNAQIEVLSMRKIKPSIEDVFIMLSARPEAKSSQMGGR